VWRLLYVHHDTFSSFNRSRIHDHYRQETAASITYLTDRLSYAKTIPSELRVLDLCTGTGCIPLLFQHQFNKTRRDRLQLCLLGVDISQTAVRLAKYNHRRLLKQRQSQLQDLERRGRSTQNQGEHERLESQTAALHNTDFLLADVLADPLSTIFYDPIPFKAGMNLANKRPFWNILISNPPYISPNAFNHTTTRSVRAFEPKTALVPPAGSGTSDVEQGDAFYPRLLAIANEVKVQLCLFEVADLDQAVRVAHMVRDSGSWDGVEIWRDCPELADEPDEDCLHDGFEVIGQGNGRSVVCWRGRGSEWIGRANNEVRSDRRRSSWIEA
jgi:methylase of polypeptide subunit release factors